MNVYEGVVIVLGLLVVGSVVGLILASRVRNAEHSEEIDDDAGDDDR